MAEYLGKNKGTWRGVPTTVGSQVKPCCSRFDLPKQDAGLDLREMFPGDQFKYDTVKIANWNWDTYLTAAEEALPPRLSGRVAERRQSSDGGRYRVGALFNSCRRGQWSAMTRTTSRSNSDETRTALEYSWQINGYKNDRGLCLGLCWATIGG